MKSFLKTSCLLLSLSFIGFGCAKSQADIPSAQPSRAGEKKVQPIRLDSEKSGYKFYSPCINYSGQLAKNDGC